MRAERAGQHFTQAPRGVLGAGALRDPAAASFGRYSHSGSITQCQHFGPARLADVAAVQDQPVVRVVHELRRA